MSVLVRRIRHLRDDRAQSLVEFALILPFLMILLMGVFEVGHAWQKFQTLTDAAREGARIAAVASGDAQVDSADVYQAVDDALGRAKLDPTLATVTYVNLLEGTGKRVSVRIEYPHPFYIVDGLLGRFRGNDGSSTPGPVLTLTTQSSFRNE